MSDDIARDVERLREWSLKWSDTVIQAAQVRRVLAFLEDQSRLCVALAERCRAQAELLGRRAEREGAA